MLNIYPSTKVRPYVYICVNRITGEFYIGYREKNVKSNLTSDIDFPLYKTSSKIVNPIFEQFDYLILAEFETGDNAYDFEQQLIFENWDNPLLLNKNCQYGSKNRFKTNRLGTTISDIHRAKLILARNKRGKLTEKTKNKISASLLGIPKTEDHKKKSGAGNLGKRRTADERQKIKDKRALQVILPQPIVKCPHCNKEGGKGNMKRFHFNNCKFKSQPVI